MTPTREDCPLGGRRLSVARWQGAAPGVLALHGFSGAGADFAPLAARLPHALAAPDLLGHARSDAPDDVAAYDLARQAAGLRDLPAALGLERPALLGYSYGGRLALQVLLDAPGAFRAAVLVGATPGIEDAAARAARAAEDEALAARIEALGAPAFLAEWSRRPLIATQARIAAPDRARMTAERARHTARGLAGALRGGGAGRMRDLWPRLGELDLPVLLLTGAEDARFAAIAQRILAHLPRAEHAVVPGAGHCAHLEAPDAAADAIARFLSAV